MGKKNVYGKLEMLHLFRYPIQEILDSQLTFLLFIIINSIFMFSGPKPFELFFFYFFGSGGMENFEVKIIQERAVPRGSKI